MFIWLDTGRGARRGGVLERLRQQPASGAPAGGAHHRDWNPLAAPLLRVPASAAETLDIYSRLWPDWDERTSKAVDQGPRNFLRKAGMGPRLNRWYRVAATAMCSWSDRPLRNGPLDQQRVSLAHPRRSATLDR